MKEIGSDLCSFCSFCRFSERILCVCVCVYPRMFPVVLACVCACGPPTLRRGENDLQDRSYSVCARACAWVCVCMCVCEPKSAPDFNKSPRGLEAPAIGALKGGSFHCRGEGVCFSLWVIGAKKKERKKMCLDGFIGTATRGELYSKMPLQ